MAWALVLTAAMGFGVLIWLTPQLLMRLDSWLDLQRLRVTPATLPAKAPIPGDLESLANAYPEEWAREDTLKRFREMYEESGDWDRVRSAATELRIGE